MLDILSSVNVSLSLAEQAPPRLGSAEIAWVAAAALGLTLLRFAFQIVWKNVWLSFGVGDSRIKSKEVKGKAETAEERGQRAFACSESAWKLVYYSAIWALGWHSIYGQPFWNDTRLCYVGWPNVPISGALNLFYLTQLAFYTHSAFVHFTFEVRRGDFWQMLAHHVVTVILIGGSYSSDYQRLGGVLLFIHDGLDVLLEVGKIALYAGVKPVAHAVLGSLLPLWWGLRVVFWAYKVYYSALFESHAVIGDEMPHYYLFNALLGVIFSLNIFWGKLLAQAVLRKLFTGVAEDIRESKSD